MITDRSFFLSACQDAPRWHSGWPNGDRPVGSGGGSSGGSGDVTFSLPAGLADGADLILSHSAGGFGTGPAHSVFDAFSALAPGVVITTANSRFSTVDAYTPPVTALDSRSPGCSIEGFVRHSMFNDGDAAAWRSAEAHHDFTATHEVFISYAVKVPIGFRSPGTAAPMAHGQWSGDSSWKMNWLLLKNGGAVKNDICLPTHVSAGVIHEGGNDISPALKNHGANPAWWKWGQWNRITRYIKADPINPATANGLLWMHHIAGGTQYSESVIAPIMAAAELPAQGWDSFHIPGWARESAYRDGNAGARSGVDVKTLYDDIYLATGAGACARVELGDAATYSACTKLAICELASTGDWTAPRVKVAVRPGDLDLNGPVWAFVFTAAASATPAFIVKVN